MTDVYHSIIGLPESGKTTFLAALWHIIDAGEVPTDLKLDTLIGDHKYLNVIVDAWRNCVKVPRTSVQDEQSISIHIHHPASNQRIVLGFADLSGESFNIQVASRKCTSEYVDNCNHEGGVILFVNADRVQDGMNIVDLAPLLDGAEEARESKPVTEWAHKLVPQQVRLVELLQFLQRPPFTRRHRRLVVAISAWDVVQQPRPAPETWLERECPLLHQYLIANPDSFKFKVFGISAQGGDIPKKDMDPTDEQLRIQSELLRKIPSERIECIGPDTKSHDLTVPIHWLTRVE